MKYFYYLFLLLCTGAIAGEVNLELRGQGIAGQTVMISVINDANEFPEGSRFRQIKIEASSDSPTVVIDQLPAGRYALAVFVDKNKNGLLDRGLFSKPTEPYGFSRNARGLFGPPSFDEAEFEVNETSKNLSINLK